MKITFNLNLLNNFMQQNNLSKKQFCKLCNISTYKLNKIFSHKTNIRLTNMLKLRDYTKIPLKELVIIKK